MKTVSISIIQKCQLSDDTYSKAWFTKLINEASQEDFNLFCREIAHLNHDYSTTRGCHVTDNPTLIRSHPNLFWEMEMIDFNDPITFKQIE